MQKNLDWTVRYVRNRIMQLWCALTFSNTSRWQIIPLPIVLTDQDFFSNKKVILITTIKSLWIVRWSLTVIYISIFRFNQIFTLCNWNMYIINNYFIFFSSSKTFAISCSLCQKGYSGRYQKEKEFIMDKLHVCYKGSFLWIRLFYLTYMTGMNIFWLFKIIFNKTYWLFVTLSQRSLNAIHIYNLHFSSLYY